MRFPELRADDRQMRWAFALFLTVPIATAVVVALSGEWIPVGDDGLLLLRADDVGSSHHPLLGSWTSVSKTVGEDINNPGAWYSYLIAAPVAVLGPITGGAIAVALLNSLAVLAIVWAAGGWGGSRAAIGMGAAAAGLCWAMGSELLIDVWQPHALLLPATLFMVLAVGVGDGRSRFVPWLLAVGSVIVQTHLGYVYLIGLTSILALALGGVRRRTTLRQGPLAVLRTRTALLSGLALLAAWLPALVDLARYGSDSNLARLLRSLGEGESTLGLVGGVRVAGQVLVAPWSRLRFANAVTPAGVPNALEIPGLLPSAIASLVLTVTVVALFLLRRATESRGVRTALEVAIGVVPITVIALSLLPLGQLVGAHQVRWTFAVGIYVWGALACGSLEAMRVKGPGATQGLAVVAAGIALATTIPYAHDHGPVRDRWARPTLNAVADGLAGVELPEPLYFDTTNVRFADPYSGTVVMLLGAEGVDFRVPDEFVPQVGRGRAVDGSEAARLYQLEGAAALHHVTDDCRVLLVDGLSAEERADVAARVSQLADGLDDGTIGLDDAALAGREEYEYLVRMRRDGERRGAEWTVITGNLARWADEGLVDPRAAERISTSRDEIEAWVRTVYALYLETDAACPG